MNRPLRIKLLDHRTHDPWFASRLRRGLAAALVAGSLMSLACHTWRGVVPKQLADRKPAATQYSIRLTFPEGTVVLEDKQWTLDYPRIQGRIKESKGFKGFKGWSPGEAIPGRPANERAFNLEKVQLADVHEFSHAKTWSLVAGGVPVAALLVILATKGSSCPIVQVDQGHGFETVGEGYPGAVFRCLRREDLLALPTLKGADLSLRLVNLAQEIQYTDVAELWAVDHGSELRVLATFQAGLVRVGQSEEAEAASDFEGRDVRALVKSRDGEAWQSALDTVRVSNRGPLREGVAATFAPSGPRPVLELTVENTRWTEVVVGRYFALMGNRFEEFLAKANDGDPKALLAWRDREGVDLRVEVEQNGRFVTVATVPATGAVEMRQLAVPLPPGLGPGPVRVRVSGALGFWRIDHLSMSEARGDEPVPVRIAPASAVDGAGRNQLDLLARKDGSFQELPLIGDRVDLRFPLPALESGKTRTCFLRTFGYYNPYPPAFPNKSLAKAKTIRDEPGALARFGLDFYRQNQSQLHGGGGK